MDLERIGEPRVPDHFVVAVRGAGMNGLRKGVIGCCKENQELGMAPVKILLGQAVEGRLLINWMDDRPVQRKEDNAFTFKPQLMILPVPFSILHLQSCEEELNLHVQQLTFSLIHNPEHESVDSPVRSNQPVSTVDDLCSRSAEAGKEETGSQGKPG